jgi:hypothetical protein
MAEPTTTVASTGNGAATQLRARAAARLEALRTEYRRAREHLQRLDAQRADLADLMLRQSGAIQVLTELVGEAGPEPDAHGDAPATRADPTGSSFVTAPDPA